MSDLLGAFQKVNVGEYPDVHLLDDDLDAALWVLMVGAEKVGRTSLSAAEVSDVLTHGYLRPLTRQRAASVLGAAKGLVVRKASASPAQFTVMKAGSDRIRGRQSDVLLIDPEKAFQTAQRMERLLSGLQGNILLCDPYVDEKTLVQLTSIPKTSSIKLLTVNIQDSAKFRPRFGAYSKEFGNLEVRVSTLSDLHDRYLIDGSRMWLIGTSLNGIGKKQSFVVAMGGDLRQASADFFNRRWNQSPKWA